MKIYKEILKEKLKLYFDIKENYTFDGIKFDLYGHFKSKNVKYITFTKLEIFSMKSNEFLFFKKKDKPFCAEDLKDIKKFMKKNVDDIVHLEKDHRNSVLTFIFETPLPTDKTLLKKIKNFSFYKGYLLGIRGWVNGKLFLIDPTKKIGISNKFGSEDLNTFLNF